MYRNTCASLLGISSLILIFAAPSQVQGQWTWPEKPENLQVLPEDWPGSRLRPVMTGFTRALGVRCSHCHVGEEGQPLTTYDFASDENPNKDRAREMLRMLGSINDHLDNIESSGDPVNMWCHTCHRGRPRPLTLTEELGETYRANGLDAAISRFSELKGLYYGKGAYNFEDEGTLNDLGYAALGEDDAEGAILVFRLNAFQFPASANVWDSLAEAYARAGNTDLAVKYYNKSLDLNPNNQNAKDILEGLQD